MAFAVVVDRCFGDGCWLLRLVVAVVVAINLDNEDDNVANHTPSEHQNDHKTHEL